MSMSRPAQKGLGYEHRGALPIAGTLNEGIDQAMDAGQMSDLSQRVLIVDDEPGLLDAMETAFRRAGRNVVAARTFEEARSRLLAEDFHCLITDVRLGAFNGIQLAVIARNRSPKMGIIVFSGFDDAVLREEAAHLGASYLVKPVTAEHLLQLVDAC
jgi:two-component system, response regulator YesN